MWKMSSLKALDITYCPVLFIAFSGMQGDSRWNHTFFIWNLMVDRTSSTLASIASLWPMGEGNLPAFARPGPRIRGIILINDSEARKASYRLAESKKYNKTLICTQKLVTPYPIQQKFSLWDGKKKKGGGWGGYQKAPPFQWQMTHHQILHQNTSSFRKHVKGKLGMQYKPSRPTPSICNHPSYTTFSIWWTL